MNEIFKLSISFLAFFLLGSGIQAQKKTNK
jgi:hypothetical protein